MQEEQEMNMKVIIETLTERVIEKNQEHHMAIPESMGEMMFYAAHDALDLLLEKKMKFSYQWRNELSDKEDKDKVGCGWMITIHPPEFKLG